jgi:hypothetical protein
MLQRICSFLLLLNGLSWPLFGTAQVRYPSYEEVVQFCYSHYPGKTVPTFRLIKHPDGYQMVFSEDQPPVPVWSPVRKWLSIPPVDRSGTRSSVPVEVFDSTEIRNYVKMHLLQNAYTQAESDRLPYYGYRGYYKDVIRVLEPSVNQLTDSELHGLARAYSAAASALLHDNSSLADSAELFRLAPGRGVMSEQQIQQYRLAQQKAVETYRHLLQRNPDFPTPVGSIRVKYANEIMDGYLHLLYYQSEESAKVMLKKGIYDPEFLVMPENLLKSCPPNAVLITYGDGDTYPLLYLQAVEQVRTDVRVVNSSLLSTPRYGQYVYDGAYSQSPLQRLLPATFFQHLTVLENTNDTASETVSARTFLEGLADITLISTKYGYKMASCPIPVLELPPAPADKWLAGYPGISPVWESGANYLTMESVIPLDIVTAGNWSTPVCFAPTCEYYILQPWRRHLILEGMVWRLVPHKLPAPNWDDAPVHMGRSIQMLQNSFQYPNLNRRLRDEEIPLYHYWLLAHQQVILGLTREKRLKEALTLMNKLSNTFTEKMAFRGFSWIPVVELYAQCGDNKSAGSLARQIVANFSGGKLDEYQMANKDKGLERLNQIARKYRFSLH